MAGIYLEKGLTIYESGKPMTALHLIMDGCIEVTYPGGTYKLEKGDVIGICEICSEIHFLEYTVLEDAQILTYSLNNLNALNNLFEKHSDIIRLFLLSAFRQINSLLEHHSISVLNCSKFYQNIQHDYATYQTICSHHQIEPHVLENINNLTTYIADEEADLWLSSYYLELSHLLSSDDFKIFTKNPMFSSGLLRKCSLDFRKIFTVLDEQFSYTKSILSLYFNSNCDDLFEYITSLYFTEKQIGEINEELLEIINRMSIQIKKCAGIDHALASKRVEAFKQKSALLKTNSPSMNTEAQTKNSLNELENSLNTILAFAGFDFKEADSFRKHILSYKQTSDKMGTEADICSLRSILTSEFCKLYSVLFRHTLEISSIPTPVMMCLYFGYIDEELAGNDYALYLLELAKGIEQNSSCIYTFYDWLLEIYHGHKEPSRNEYEQDYSDYVHKLKINHSIDSIQEQEMLNDQFAKIDYELENLFPVANKITYGRISTYCPIFIKENILIDLKDSFVSTNRILDIMKQITQVDYSLFYRESLDMDHIQTLDKELLHFDYFPNIILMPNVGIRGCMWQEIEGKRRTTAGRFLLSIFHMEDLTLTAIRLAAEFRWEMCKRIQGPRWNDVSDPSLTSEYFDYVQFYRKNHDLSSEAKEKVRSSLQRAKNSFKEMFIKDYALWILCESKGAPRLNKVARRIFFFYCPVSKSIYEQLRQNPLYAELINQKDIKIAQRLHHLDILTKKINNSGTPVPDSLEQEKLYTTGTV